MNRLLRAAIVVLVLALVASGVPNAFATSSANLYGKVLHVWSHDMDSSYVEVHIVDRDVNSGSTYSVKQNVYATNYAGTAGAVLLEVQVEDKRKGTMWFSIYWFGRDEVEIYAGDSYTTVPLDMSVPHNYQIEVTQRVVRFYIDGSLVYEAKYFRIIEITQVNTGRWDKESIYDLYIDNVEEYWSGRLVQSESFEDGIDNFYNADVYIGSGDSDEEIIDSEEVPVFPFLSGLLEAIENVFG